MKNPEDFYEDDEPIEKILAAFDHGPKGTTKRPAPQASSGPLTQIRWMYSRIQRRYGPGSGYDPGPGWYERGGQ